jgi:hypothetical protein
MHRIRKALLQAKHYAVTFRGAIEVCLGVLQLSLLFDCLFNCNY